MKHTVEYDCECTACQATGLYCGMGEKEGAGIVCHTCKGTGQVHKIHKYTDFEGRKKKRGVMRVYQANPGICIGTGNGHRFSDFGGMPYDLWEKGQNFPEKSEMRQFTCPAWWYQSADYKKKPNWSECNDNIGGAFSGCKHFDNKHECWERFDKED